MLFTADSWEGIRDGSITRTFRRWSRAQAKTGGRYRVGRMLIEASDVRQVSAGSITNADAVAAGTTDRAQVVQRLGDPAPETLVWRIDFRYVGDDDRLATRRDDHLDDDAIAALRARFDRMDAASQTGPWTRPTLAVIAAQPGVVSTDLAPQVGQERFVFKANVRKLKELGLTESLAVGYQLSPRGQRVLELLDGLEHHR